MLPLQVSALKAVQTHADAALEQAATQRAQFEARIVELEQSLAVLQAVVDDEKDDKMEQQQRVKAMQGEADQKVAAAVAELRAQHAKDLAKLRCDLEVTRTESRCNENRASVLQDQVLRKLTGPLQPHVSVGAGTGTDISEAQIDQRLMLKFLTNYVAAP